MLIGMIGQAHNRLKTLYARKQTGRKFSVLTCYDAVTARIMANAEIEVLLVGDTAGEVVLGLPSTRDVTAEFMIAITKAVRRGAGEAIVLGDLPLCCQKDGFESTIQWCRRFHEEAGCDAIKIEVTDAESGLVSALSKADVPIVAHIGLLPQSVDPKVGYRAQGREAIGAAQLLQTAKRLEEAGASMLLLEAVASEVAGVITRQSHLPVIGCVSGPHCDGTVVVLHDMLGLSAGHRPRAVKQYEDLSGVLGRAFKAYADDIHANRFPVEQDAIHMKPGEYDKFIAMISG